MPVNPELVKVIRSGRARVDGDARYEELMRPNPDWISVTNAGGANKARGITD